VFANLRTWFSIVSSAIFWASKMSPVTRPPFGTKHHRATRKSYWASFRHRALIERMYEPVTQKPGLLGSNGRRKRDHLPR
jgi:hypothetical protein